MSHRPSDDADVPRDDETQDSLPPLELEVSPEDVPSSPEPCLAEADQTFGEPLDVIRQRELEARVASLEHQLEERRDLHQLRKRHSSRLFGLTVCWISVVWLVVLLQGFGQWFFPIPDALSYIRFKLSDTVAVAFITSTTATVLGLYGIAAYWLFGKAKPKVEDEKADSKKPE